MNDLDVNKLNEAVLYLRGLGDGSIKAVSDNGLCIIVEHNFGTDIKLYMRELMQEWPEYSGQFMYPISSPVEGESPMGVFWGGTPRWSGEYGNSRKRLATFLANKLENELIKEGNLTNVQAINNCNPVTGAHGMFRKFLCRWFG